jgi:hypothetical protein
VFKVFVSVCVVVCCSHINSACACRTVCSPACNELLNDENNPDNDGNRKDGNREQQGLSPNQTSIPTVTLIKGNEIHKNAYVLTGICSSCKTLYLADRERSTNSDNTVSRMYLNSARYLKVGQSTWVDRVFSAAVLNGMYSFHASAAAYTEFWNNSYSENSTGKITR